MENLPVIFRKDRAKHPTVTAVFPTLPAGDYTMTCYAHVGQHSGCCYEWYHGTRAAKPEEYADLLAELQQIYEQDEDEPVKLVVYRKITPQMREQYRKNNRAMMHPGDAA